MSEEVKKTKVKTESEQGGRKKERGAWAKKIEQMNREMGI